MTDIATQPKKRSYNRGGIYFSNEALFQKIERVCEKSAVKLSPLLQALAAAMTEEELIEAAKKGSVILSEAKAMDNSATLLAIQKVDPAALEAFLKQQGAL